MKRNSKKDNKSFKSIILKKFISKSLICMILFLLFLILNRKIDKFDDFIYKNVYNNNISFAKFNYWYESHFGSIFPLTKAEDVLVFNETITYKEKEKYLDGVLLIVEEKYLVPSLNNGIVIFIGEKNNYGKTIIIEDEKGLDTWYSNINVGNINMYDYVNKGDYLGEVIDNRLIMLFQKDGEIEDYNKYI